LALQSQPVKPSVKCKTMMEPTVYLDTNIYKFSATKLTRLRPRTKVLKWGDLEFEGVVHDFVTVNPNDKIINPELRTEVNILPELAEFGKEGKVKYIIQTETLLESWGIPNMDSRSGKFYGAPIDYAKAPIQYERVLVGGFEGPQEMQFDFLAGIKNKRFEKLQKITGAYQGPGKLNRNQLLDAFHIWCAEYNKCNFFLTLDLKLIKVINKGGANRLSTRLIRPSELLAELRNT